MSNKKNKTPLKRKFISLEKKIEILDKLNEGEKASSIAKSLHLNEATIRTIKKNENKIRRNVAEGSPLGAKRAFRAREIDIVKMENALSIWIEDCTNKQIALSGNIIKQKALQIYKHLKENGPSSTEDITHSFSASKGWFENFKKRLSLHNIKFQTERVAADAESTHKFSLDSPQIIDKQECKADQIVNADEFSSYWKKMPSHTYTTADQKFISDFKTAKDQFTILMYSNLSGHCLLNHLNAESALNLTENDVIEGMDLAKKLELHFTDKDPSKTRSEKLKKNLQSCLAPYRQVLQELQSQSTLSSKPNSIIQHVDEEISSDNDLRVIKQNRTRTFLYDSKDKN